MKHFLALPALLRASILLASASQHTFSVHDDLLAFPQYEVKFTEDYLSEPDAQGKLQTNDQLHLQSDNDALQQAPASQIEQYRAQDSYGDGKQKDELQREHEYMVLEGQRYLCSIPVVKKPEETAGRNDTLSQAEEQRELARATDRGWELLAPMQGNCVYFISGWWSYRFCYGQGVKQFHQLPPSRGVPVYPPVEDPNVDGFELGNYQLVAAKKADDSDDVAPPQETGTAEEWDGESALDVSEAAKTKHTHSGNGDLVQRGESRYLVQRLAGGTQCDLTGKDRRIEVQFHCNPQSADRISLIKETSTCAYLMVIQTPRLCNDVAFLPPQKDQPNAISCAPILADEEVEDYEEDLQTLKSEEKDAAAAMAGAGAPQYDAPVQVVGNIVIGGHALVPEDKKIEKGTIVGGGKETYIDTVASSDGRILSEDDLKRLGLGDPKAVEKLKKELEKIAAGQNWKLDVIDTPRGREYRGIIGDEDEEGKDEKTGEDGKNKKKGSDEDESQAGSQEEYYKEEL